MAVGLEVHAGHDGSLQEDFLGIAAMPSAPSKFARSSVHTSLATGEDEKKPEKEDDGGVNFFESCCLGRTKKMKAAMKCIEEPNDGVTHMLEDIQGAQASVEKARARVDAEMAVHAAKMKPICDEYLKHHGFLEGRAGLACVSAQGMVNRAIPDLQGDRLSGCMQSCAWTPKHNDVKEGGCDKCQKEVLCTHRINELMYPPADPRKASASIDDDVRKWCHPDFILVGKGGPMEGAMPSVLLWAAFLASAGPAECIRTMCKRSPLTQSEVQMFLLLKDS